MQVFRAAVIAFAPCIYVALLPALQFIEGQDGQTFATHTIESYSDGTQFRSVSLFISNSPAAGVFGFIVGSALTALSFRSDLMQFIAQKFTLAFVGLSIFMLMCTPVLTFPVMHTVATSLVMISTALFLVVTTFFFSKNCRVWGLIILSVFVFLGTTILRIFARRMDLGYSYYLQNLFGCA